MKKRFFYILGFVALIFILYPQVPVARGQGKANAPGQTKKVEVGSVEEVSKNSVTIESKKNNKKTEAEINNSTVVIGRNKQSLKIGAIKLKDTIALISSDSGTASKSGKFKVNKIFVQDASASALLKRRAVMGVITDISGNVITLAHQIQQERTFTVIKTAQTIITGKESKDASGSASLPALSVGQRITAVGDLDGNGAIIAKRIHIIPGKATGIFKRLPVSTPSASLVATPSAAATPSATSEL